MMKSARSCIAWIVAVLALNILIANADAGSIIYVDDDARTNGNGVAWSTPYKFLQDALAFASDPKHGVSEIHVAGGMYKPDRDAAHPLGSGDRESTFRFLSGVAIKGGYRGLAAGRGQNPDDRNIAKFTTTLSGDLAGDDLPAFVNRVENSYQVVTGHNVDNTAALDGVTITAGYANGPGFGATPRSRDQGAGVNVYDAQPMLIDCILRDNWNINHGALNDHGDCTLIRCTFRENHAVLLGAGLYIHHHAGTVAMDCNFFNNVSEHEGGGAYSRSFHNAMLINCHFEGNEAVGGGGMYNADESATMIMDCEFINNTASSGAGMYNSYSSPMVMNCFFTGNDVVGAGGAIYCDFCADAMVVDSTFTQNLTSGGGGGMWNDGGTISIDNCTFTGNTGENGAGVYNGDHCIATITNCTFTDNVSSVGGGISNAESNSLVEHCTFINNGAFGDSFSSGGGVNNYISSAIVRNCLFQGNRAQTGGAGVYNEAESPIISHCVFIGNVTMDESKGWGGGMLVGYYTTGIVENCSFVGNTANRGGGFFSMFGAQTDVINCTFASNIANASGLNSGGGGYAAAPNSGANLINCIAWGNSPDQINDENVIVEHSCVQGGYMGNDNIDSNPMFTRDPSPGADGIWGSGGDDDFGDLQLQRNSSCIDHGDNSLVPLWVNLDLAGRPRFQDDPATPNRGVTGGNHAIVDLGAFEFQPRLCAADVASTPNGVVDADDLLFIILHWGQAGGPADIAPAGGDGVVNVLDLQAVLDSWGACR